jgi:predicted metal-dependent peptidase
VTVLAHEVLHMVLCHVHRFKQLPRPDNSKPAQYYLYLANYAADIVVNGVIRACGDVLALPQGAILDTKLELLSLQMIKGLNC